MTDRACNARDARCRFCGRTREDHDPNPLIDCPGGEGSRAVAAMVTGHHADCGPDCQGRAVESMLAAVTCRHCGALPDADGDHSCPCPNSDEECREHPAPTVR